MSIIIVIIKRMCTVDRMDGGRDDGGGVKRMDGGRKDGWGWR